MKKELLNKSKESKESKESVWVPDSPNDYVEKRKCACFTLKFWIFSLGILIVFSFIFECFLAYEIVINYNFEVYYGIIYCCFVMILFIGVLLWYHMWMIEESASHRAVIPSSFMLTSVANLCLFLWVIIYICGVFDKPKVLIPKYSNNENPQNHTRIDNVEEEDDSSSKIDYIEETKFNYVFKHTILQIFLCIFYFVNYFVAVEWVERH